MGCQLALQILRHHAVIIGLNGQQAAFIGAEHRQGRQIGGVLADHQISRFQEDLARQIQSLLGTADDQDILRRAGNSLPCQALCQLLPQGQIAGGGAVLQGRAALRAINLVGRLPHGLHWKGFRRRQTARKRDDLLLGGQSQRLAQDFRIHL